MPVQEMAESGSSLGKRSRLLFHFVFAGSSMKLGFLHLLA